MLWWCAELGELTIRRDLPVQCGQGRAGSRKSLCCGTAGLQCFPALRYLLRLHLLKGIAVHVPLGVTGHLATLKCLGSRSQPTSWKGSRQLSHGQCWQGRGVPAVPGGQQKLRTAARQQVRKHARRQHLHAWGEAEGN